MAKIKTCFTIDEDLYKKFQIFVIMKHGTKKKISFEVENALREYLEKNGKGSMINGETC